MKYSKILVLTLMGAIAFSEFSSDPSLVKTSARSVALGNAFSAMADDYAALFVNPAGLTQIGNTQYGLMQNAALDSVFSLNGGGVFPLNQAVLGVGAQFSGVTGIQSTARDILTNRITSTGSSDYSNSILAVALASMVRTPFTRDNTVAIGLTGKLMLDNVGGR